MSGTANSASQSLHSEAVGKQIWDGKYAEPIRKAFDALRQAEDSGAELDELMHHYMECASTLFSAYNSPLSRLSCTGMNLVNELIIILEQIEKFVSKGATLTPMDKEVLVACNMLVAEVECYFGSRYEQHALRYAREVLGGSRVPLSTLLLVRARVSRMRIVVKEEHEMHAKIVRGQLKRIMDNPAKIEDLGQGWYTFVRLSRMMFFFPGLVFGHRQVKSRDLLVKSVAYVIAHPIRFI